jgi:beta-xylosidase
MKRIFLFFSLFALFIIMNNKSFAWEGMPTPRLHVDGKHLKDPHGNIVKLHGFAQTYSPWFNEMGQKWDNYNVNGCLSYNQGLIDDMLEAGWMMSFVRLHMDPYWSNTPGCTPDGHELPNCFSETRFRKYLDEVFIPMAEYAISKGMYVIMRPPGVAPHVIGVEDDYDYAQYLMTVWDIVSNHPKIKNSDEIMLELANEPVNIRLADGSVGANTQAHFDVLKEIFQPIVNRIRENGFHNVIWIPGSGYQAHYKGYAVNPIEGENIGYAVHVYPGWFGSADGYEVFKREWDQQVKPVADFAPIVITEMDWAPEKYNASWGKSYTGTAGGDGFGANFKKIMDETGNVSWLLFTEPHRLAQFKPEPPAPGQPYTFLNDPEACPWPIYHWYKEYALENYPRPNFTKQSHSDNGDGTYTNPLIHADFPDPDVVHVGDVYYMVSTTMHIFPGATILKSHDLVNWEYASNPLQMIESSDAYNLLNGQNRYSKGQWATALNYNNGTFYLLFNTLDEGSYLLTATNPEGNWTMKKLSTSFYDPGLLFDDGKIYIIHGINQLRITQVDQNFEPVGSDITVVEKPNTGLEGCRFYKIGVYYYIYATYGGWPASQVAFRSKNISGPYEEKLLLADDNIHQGALVKTQTGEWWTLLFYDKGAYGRLPNLQPITWVNDWPEIGVNGKGVTTYRKPNVGRDYPIKVLPTTDNFRNHKLDMQWGWNHNPDNTKWSLFDRPGFLRLQTAGVVNSFLDARNTLTQRIFGYHSNDIESYATIKLHISNMKEGDFAGLAVFQDPYASIGVTMQDGERKLVRNNNGIMQMGVAIPDSVIYLRVVANYGTSRANFYYSFDNITFTRLGSMLSMKFNLSIFTGNKFCIFNYATQQSGGYVDVDWFTTEEVFSEELFYDPTFSGFSEDQLTLDSVYMDKDQIYIIKGNNKTLVINAKYKDGRVENVGSSAVISNSNPEVAHIINGQIVAKNLGTTTITATIEGKLGGSKTIEFDIVVTLFPLTNELFNPSIWDKGTFDEETGRLVTAQWGFGGWQYQNGIDLSDYRYLVVRLKQATQSGASFRIFDQSSYWSDPYMVNVGSRTEFVVDLEHMCKEVNGVKVKANPANIYIVGFWSHGNNPIYIDDVFLSNSEQYAIPITDCGETNNINIKVKDKKEISENDIVNIFTLTGGTMRREVVRRYAAIGLPTGLYIIGNAETGYQKIVVPGF